MTLLMRDQEMIRKGREEGREKGREEGRAELIKSMLQNGKTAEEIAFFTGVSLPEVKQVEENMLTG